MQAADIIAFRRQYAMSMTDLANAIGTNPGAISQIERGKRALTSSMAARLNRYFGFFRDCEKLERL